MIASIAHSRLRLLLLSLASAGGVATCAFAQTTADEDSQITVLEKFIASETMIESSSTLLPNSRPVDSLYGFGMNLRDTPRAVTVLTPETLAQRNIKDV